MILTTLILCFVLSLMPLVISSLSFRYAANRFSRGIVGLSAVGFVLGLAQFGLLLGMSYRLFSAETYPQAAMAYQWVSVVGATIMIFAGMLWVGYFRTLMKKAPVREQAMARTRQPEVVEAARPVEKLRKTVSMKRRERPEGDWFAEELPSRNVVRLAAEVGAKKRVRKSKTA